MTEGFGLVYPIRVFGRTGHDVRCTKRSCLALMRPRVCRCEVSLGRRVLNLDFDIGHWPCSIGEAKPKWHNLQYVFSSLLLRRENTWRQLYSVKVKPGDPTYERRKLGLMTLRLGACFSKGLTRRHPTRIPVFHARARPKFSLFNWDSMSFQV